MAMRNRKSASCTRCGLPVEQGKGFASRNGGDWITLHTHCTRRALLGKGKDQPTRDLLLEFKKTALAVQPNCAMCNMPVTWWTATVDHIVPLVRGGAHALENFQLACRDCNVSKGNKE